MNNLVISVTPDSSLSLLNKYADIITLDDGATGTAHSNYETVYVRSHFSKPETLPQNFRKEIDAIVKAVKDANPDVRFIDAMDNVDAIVAFEDKWRQYQTFGKFMPRTELLGHADVSSFTRPIYKKRLSSRGSGVTWMHENVTGAADEWIAQETIEIKEELRIYVINGEVYPVTAVKQSMIEGQKAEGINSRLLTQDEIEFTAKLKESAPELDFVGIDIARADDGMLYLMEVNRSPGFAKFEELTGVNLADKLYG